MAITTAKNNNYCNCGEKNYDDGSKDASDDGGNGSVKKNVNHEKMWMKI